MRIAIIGAGNVGGGLGTGLAQAGHEVVFGVRDPDSEKTRAAAGRRRRPCQCQAPRGDGQGLAGADRATRSLDRLRAFGRLRLALLPTPAWAALAARRAQGAARLRDLAVVLDLDVVPLGGRYDLLPSTLLGRGALELSLVPARHPVPDVRLVVAGEVLSALLVDVRELAAPQAFALLRGELSHLIHLLDRWRCSLRATNRKRG